ncbi:MAG: hypothetical protein PVF97_11120 [Desulfobacterales bacterium]
MIHAEDPVRAIPPGRSHFLTILISITTITQSQYATSAVQVKYDRSRERMPPGDVIAFGGMGHFSEISPFFGAERVAAGLEKTGAVGIVNDSEVTPSDGNV